MGDGERRRGGRCKKKSELTESESGGLTSSIVNTYNNDSVSVDKPSVNKNSVDNTNIGTDASISVSINKNDDNVDKPNIKKSSGKGKTSTSNINANKAKFEEDVKKEPILQVILDVFDGELLS